MAKTATGAKIAAYRGPIPAETLPCQPASRGRSSSAPPPRPRRGGRPWRRLLGRRNPVRRAEPVGEGRPGPGRGPAGDVPSRGRDRIRRLRVLGRRRPGRDDRRRVQGPLLPDEARPVGTRSRPVERQATRRPAAWGLRHGDAVGPPRVLGGGRRRPRPAVVQAVRRDASIHRREHPVQLLVRDAGGRPGPQVRRCGRRGEERRLLQEAAVWAVRGSLRPPDRKTVPRRRQQADGQGGLFGPAEPKVVPGAGRCRGEGGLRPRPDRRPDTGRAGQQGQPGHPAGRGQQRRPDAVPEVRRRPVRQLPERPAC
jgi:hypothetical protein